MSGLGSANDVVKRVAFGVGAPLLTITIDVRGGESDDVLSMQLRHTRALCAKYGVSPTYFVDYALLDRERSVALLREWLSEDAVQVGALLDPAVTPPFRDDGGSDAVPAGELPCSFEYRKLEALTVRIEERLGVRPTAYRAHGHGFGPSTSKVLESLGYEIDASISPLLDRPAEGGIDFNALPNTPYWFGSNFDLFEVPVSGGRTGALASVGHPLASLASLDFDDASHAHAESFVAREMRESRRVFCATIGLATVIDADQRFNEFLSTFFGALKGQAARLKDLRALALGTGDAPEAVQAIAEAGPMQKHAARVEGDSGTVDRHMLHGSAWMVLMRWAIRSIGLVSTLILVRLLTPDDFGVMAAAIMITGFFEVFSETGQRLAIIRHPNPSRGYLDSAWTAQVIVCTIIAVLIYLSAPLAELFFQSPKAGDIVRVLALRPFLAGFENIGTVAFRRDLNFSMEFRYGVYQKVASTAATIIAAVVLMNYWALAIGIVVGQVGALIVGYAMHPYRPRFAVSHIREIWSYSLWILAGQVSTYFQMRLDQMALGVTGGTPRQLGEYSVAADLAALPIEELIAPSSRALFPVFSRLAGDVGAMKAAYTRSFAPMALLSWPAGFGLASVGSDFATVLLGPQWVDAPSLIAWFALSTALLSMSNSVLTLQIASGNAKMFALSSWLRVTILGALILSTALVTTSLQHLAFARFVASVAFTLYVFATLKPLIGLSLGEIGALQWRPAAAAAMMAVCNLALVSLLSDASPYLRLPIVIVFGSLVFSLALLALWRLAGSPSTVEHEVLALVARSWRSFVDKRVGPQAGRHDIAKENPADTPHSS